MGIASLVLGIISVIGGIIPACNLFFTVPALVGLILGIVDAVKKGKTGEKKGMSIAGIVLNVIAFVVIIGMYVLVFAASAAGTI